MLINFYLHINKSASIYFFEAWVLSTQNTQEWVEEGIYLENEDYLLKICNQIIPSSAKL